MRLYSNSKRGLRVEAQQLKFEVRLYSNSKRGIQYSKFETRLKLQNSKHWENPKLGLSKSQNSRTNSRIYESLKPIATRFDSTEFVPLSRSFLASQVRVFDVSLSSPEAATASARMFHPFIESWLLLVTTTRDHVNNFITSHLIGSISYSVHGYTNQNSLNSLMAKGIAHRFKKCVTEIK